MTLFSTTACAIPRSDVLECDLPDGSKFILTSKYDWNPVGLFNPHGGPRERQKNYKVKLLRKGAFLKQDVPVFVNYTEIINISTLERACSETGVIGGVFVANDTYLKEGEAWFD